MRIVNGVCRRCFKKDHNVRDGIYHFSKENHMDFGDLPSKEELPRLTQTEEMLIARVHTYVEVRQIRGAQYRCRGHIVNFLRDTGKVYQQLPLLLRDLEIVIVKPYNTNQVNRLQRQFTYNFNVRQSVIRKWLEFLRREYPGYRDIIISEENLRQLPKDRSVIDEITTLHVDAITANDNIRSDEHQEDKPIASTALGDAGRRLHLDDVDEEDVKRAAVPDFLIQEEQLDLLQQHIQGEDRAQPQGQPQQQQHIELLPFHSTALPEFNRSQSLLSLAFPSLYPRGEGEFVTPREREILCDEYILHAIRWNDGRFARHPRFHFVVFNTLIRKQVNSRSSFFVRKTAPEDGEPTRPTTVEEIREAFGDESRRGKALLNQLVRFSGSLRGTRPYWLAKRNELDSVVDARGCPNLFVTFSAADNHWESLHRHMPRYDEWRNGTNDVKIAIARQNIRENPHIAAWHFVQRFRVFKSVFVKRKFGVVDFWNRVEWQGRGSSHSHGFLWLREAVPIDRESEEARQVFADYWGISVTALNPELFRQVPPDENPLVTDNVEFDFEFLPLVINRV